MWGTARVMRSEPWPADLASPPIIRGETEPLIAGVPGLTGVKVLAAVAAACLAVVVVTVVLILFGAGR